MKLLFIGGIGVASYSLIEPLKIDVSNLKLNLGFNLKILLVTDTHLHGIPFYDNNVYNILDNLSRNVDLTVLTGDIHDEFTPSLYILENLLSHIHSFKIFIYGNHEHYAYKKYPFKTVERIYEKYDTIVLVNDVYEYKGIRIGGIDWYYDENGLGIEYLNKIGDIDILLSHTPDAYRLPNNNAKLTLAGHTHGGQVCIPFLGPIWVPSKYGYASGLFHENYRYLYVSRGLGEVFIPFRFNCNREATLIHIS